jgi:hypothetical protein
MGYMKNLVRFILISIFIFQLNIFSQQKEYIFKGGHSVHFIDTLNVTADSTFTIFDLLIDWSVNFRDISYEAGLFLNCENTDKFSLKFSNYLGGVNFTKRINYEFPFPDGNLDAKLLITENYNDYKIQLNCNLTKINNYYLVTSTKGLNRYNEYFEKYEFWVINVIKPDTGDIATRVEEKSGTDNKISSVGTNIKITDVKLPAIVEKFDQRFSCSAGAAFESRYIWRGVDASKSPALEPYVQMNLCNFGFSVKGIYALASRIRVGKDSVEYNKIDIGLNYKYETRFCSFSLGLNDYFYPYLGLKYFEFKDNGSGAHNTELNFS